MVKRICIILFSVLATLHVPAQEAFTTEKIKTIPGEYVSFSVDNMDNIYLLSSSNQLKKLNANGDSVAVFNDIKRFGEATLVDVSNPVKILLFYKNFSTIAVLDGMLSLKNIIDLRKKDMFNVSSIALAYDGKIWIYDEIEYCLKKIDDKGTILLKTPDFRQLFDSAPVPQKIFDQSQYVYLYDSINGIYMFDYYGSFKRKVQTTGWTTFFVGNNAIYGADTSYLYKYDNTSLVTNLIPLAENLKKGKQYFLSEKYFYILKNDALEIYSLDTK
jgi:hypothetical protein